MTVALLFAWLAAVVAPPPDLHVVFKSDFVFLSSTRAASHDWWVSDGRSAARQNDRLTIVREDLGVTWRVNAKAGTYTETKRPAPGRPAAQPAAAPVLDMHT